jgi:hypothetical protein
MATVVTMSSNDNSDTASDMDSGEKRRKLRVRFGPPVEHVFEKDFTEEDLRHIWYNGEEFHAIKSEIYAMMRSVNTSHRRLVRECSGSSSSSSSNLDIDHKYHWRGFEHVRQKRPRKEIRQRHASDLIYFYHRMRGNDPTGLGVFAIRSSRDCMERAQQLAMMDECEAMAIYREDSQQDEPESHISTTEDSSIASTPASTTEEGDNDYPVDGSLTLDLHGGDEYCKTIHLLHDHHGRPPQVSPTQDNPALCLSLVTYKFVIMLFPCLC